MEVAKAQNWAVEPKEKKKGKINIYVILPQEYVNGKFYERLLAFKRFTSYGEPSWTN
jgi:hypothetical protein